MRRRIREQCYGNNDDDDDKDALVSPSTRTTTTTSCSLSVASFSSQERPVPVIYIPNDDTEQRDDDQLLSGRSLCSAADDSRLLSFDALHDSVPWHPLDPNTSPSTTTRMAQESHWHAQFGIETAHEMQAIVQWWTQQQQDSFRDTQQRDLPGNALASYYDHRPNSANGSVWCRVLRWRPVTVVCPTRIVGLAVVLCIVVYGTLQLHAILSLEDPSCPAL